MVNNQAQGIEDISLHFSVLPYQSVELLLNDYFKDISGKISADKKDDFSNFIKEVIRLTKSISPALVEEKKIPELFDLIEKLPDFFKPDQNSIDEFFNTLNLCVVGLGSALKGGKHNE